MMHTRPTTTFQIGQIRVTAMEQLEINCRHGRSGVYCYVSLRPVSVSIQTPGSDRKFQIPPVA